LVLKLENSWFMRTKYITQSKHQAFRSKYCKKIAKIVSEKNFVEEITINHLFKLLNNHKKEFNNDLENKSNNYFIKIQDSFKGCYLSLCINLKKNKEGKMKLSVRIKENGLSELGEEKEEAISLIKQEISLDLFKGLI